MEGERGRGGGGESGWVLRLVLNHTSATSGEKNILYVYTLFNQNSTSSLLTPDTHLLALLLADHKNGLCVSMCSLYFFLWVEFWGDGGVGGFSCFIQNLPFCFAFG